MDTTKVTAYLPLIQQLTKYAFLLLCLLIFAPQIITLMDATEQRLAAGGEVSIGPTGVKLGEAPKMPQSTTVAVDVGRAMNFPGMGGSGMGGVGAIIQEHVSGAPVKGMGDVTRMPTEDVYYLVHGASKDKADYSVKVKLDALDPAYLDKVEKVVYHLHESFNNNVRVVTDRSSGFALSFNAWGQFEVKADIYLKGRSGHIKLRRWLNF